MYHPPVLRPPNQRVRMVARASTVDWASACAGFTDGLVLKDHPGGTVWRANLLGRECVLKCLRLEGARRGLQSACHASPAWRHWQQARWLRAHGFSTAETWAIVRGTRDGESVECLVMQHLPGESVLEHMAMGDLPARSQHHVAAAVARLACRFVREGRYNRDAKPSNLIVTSLHKTGAHLAVIDCADLRRCPRDNEAGVVRMLTAAVVEPLGCGCLSGRGVRMRAVYSAAETLDPRNPRRRAKHLWRAVERAVAAHGDPIPRDNPLG